MISSIRYGEQQRNDCGQHDTARVFRTLWRALKELPIDGTHFRRHGADRPYVVDFFCPARRLIIELDGGHHNGDDTASAIAKGSFGLEQEDIVLSASEFENHRDLTAVLEQV